MSDKNIEYPTITNPSIEITIYVNNINGDSGET